MRFQDPLPTRAEATGYRETSTHADVLAFLDALAKSGAPIQRLSLGKSDGGLEIPLVLLGRPLPESADDARKMGKLVVYVQANIHAGEVEGKEAALMLLRDLSRSDPQRLLEKLVLLFAPIYNADGNERFGDGKRNRPHQDGPEKVGERANGKGLDLNRDCIKAESPEMRGALKEVYNAWDPDLTFDLHTTNGTRHGWKLTYAPPTHPNTDPGVMEVNRERLLPELRRRLHRDKKWDLFDYGNAEKRGAETVWATFGEEGRYVTNYVGLRNRLAILSEAVSFLPFQFRVESTYAFVRAALETVARDRDLIRRTLNAADRARPAERGVRFAMAARGAETVPLEKPRPESEIDHTKAPTEWTSARLPIYDRWSPTRTARVPAAYLIPAALGDVVALVRRHGIRIERLKASWNGRVETFAITERVQAPPFQGHRLNRLEGKWEPADATVPEGTIVVSTDQPLGGLAFHLLEPECLDGAAAWNFLDDALAASPTYPIQKSMTMPGR